MKPGFALGVVLVLMAGSVTSAQNLGLGTGSHQEAPNDTTSGDAKLGRQDEPQAPRKTQFNKRLGLTARRNSGFDPKVFEARGHDLTGQFYEIGAPSDAKPNNKDQAMPQAPAARQKIGSRQWLWWVGAAGLAGASAGVAGFILMNNSHPTTKPADIPLVLDDGP